MALASFNWGQDDEMFPFFAGAFPSSGNVAQRTNGSHVRGIPLDVIEVS